MIDAGRLIAWAPKLRMKILCYLADKLVAATNRRYKVRYMVVCPHCKATAQRISDISPVQPGPPKFL